MSYSVMRPTLAALFLGIVLLFSCAKEEETLGLEIQNADDLLGVLTSDTTTLVCRTLAGDSSRTSFQGLGMLGHIEDPVFGTMKSSIYTQTRLSIFNPDFSTLVSLDSMVFALEYNFQDSLFGVPEDELTFSVRELTTDLFTDSVYYSNSGSDIDVGVDEWVEAGSETFSMDPELTIVGDDTVSHQLRIRLDTNLARTKFIEAPEGSFDDMESFQDYFKGFRVTADIASGGNPGGSISSFDINTSATALLLYYSFEDANDSINQVALVFSINALTQRFIGFENNPAGALEMALMDSAIGQQELYIQAMTGANVEVHMPFLMDYNDSNNVAINKAELIIPINPASMQNVDQFPFPNRLFGVFTNDEGEVESIPDIFEGDTHSDGFYDESNGEYRVNVTRFVQRVLTQEIAEPRLRLLPTSNTGSANFVQLSGPENMMGPTKLVITYTKY